MPAFTRMEIETMRACINDEMLSCIFEMLLSTGCRVTELSEIKRSDIQDDKLIVHGKGNKYRTVYLNAKAQGGTCELSE